MEEYKNSNLSDFVNTSLVDVLEKKIRNNIYLGKYPAGKKLVVRELSEEFGVSHTPVKDALNRLVAEGYVEALPRKSMVVKTYTNTELMDALLARLMCEIFSADYIIEEAKKDPGIATQMQTILNKMKKAVTNSDNMVYEEWVINETQFHRCYMSHCGNPQIYKFYCELDTNKTTYLAYLDTEHKPLKMSTLESNVIEHQAITDAIVAQDSKRLVNSVIRHIARACDDYAVDDECKAKCERLKEIRKRYET